MIATTQYRVGGLVPARVEEPADAARVAALVGATAEAGGAIVAFGGSTLQALGNPPTRYTLAISLRRLAEVRQYDPRDLTIGLDAGITLAEVARALGPARQFIPFDAPQPERATVGGSLAAGWAGPRRATYGRLRDLLIGTTAALADGSLASAGGMVVKNVTGYDMSKLYVGSLGTLGIIVRANFKALPQPIARRMAIAPVPDELRERTVSALPTLAIEPTAALLIDGFAGRPKAVRGDASRLAVLFEGSSAVIDRATRELRSVLGKCGVAETVLLEDDAAADALQQIIDAYIEPVEHRSLTYRETGSPSSAWQRTAATAERVRDYGAGCDVIADLRTGDCIVRVVGRSIDAIEFVLPEIDAAVRAELPGASILAGAPELRLRVDAWGAPPTTLATQRAIKARFDPTGTFAPGRYVGGL